MVRFEHVFVVVEENQNYEEIIGNTKDLPYLNTAPPVTNSLTTKVFCG